MSPLDTDPAVEIWTEAIETSGGGGRVAAKGEPDRVSSASVTDETESRERLDPLAATSSRDGGAE